MFDIIKVSNKTEEKTTDLMTISQLRNFSSNFPLPSHLLESCNGLSSGNKELSLFLILLYLLMLTIYKKI